MQNQGKRFGASPRVKTHTALATLGIWGSPCGTCHKLTRTLYYCQDLPEMCQKCFDKHTCQEMAH